MLISELKCLNRTRSLLYIVLSCVITLFRMFLTTFKPRVICNLTQSCHINPSHIRWSIKLIIMLYRFIKLLFAPNITSAA